MDGDGRSSAVFVRHANRINPLHAVYPVATWRLLAAEGLSQGMRSPTGLIYRVLEEGIHPIQILTEDEAERIDPRLLSLFDVDTLDDLGTAKRIIDTRNYHRVRPDLKKGGI